MSIQNKRVRTIKATHPSVMLREDFWPESSLSWSGFAKSLPAMLYLPVSLE
jgi:hypothetical protein